MVLALEYEAMNYKLIAVNTIPHTGTHRLMHLARLHPALGWVGLSHCSEAVQRLLKDNVDLNTFKQELLSGMKNADPKTLGLTLEEPRLDFDLKEEPKYILLFSHIKEYYIESPKYGFGVCVQDVIEKFNVPQIMLLRDPLLVICTGIILRRGDEKSTDEAMRMIRAGFEYILNTKVDTFFIPIDLLSRQTSDQRIEKIRSLCIDFLGTSFPESYKDVVIAWDKIHPTNYASHAEHWISGSPDTIFRCKDTIARGENPKGINSIVDGELEYYSGHTKLKELFKSFGYRDLLWF